MDEKRDEMIEGIPHGMYPKYAVYRMPADPDWRVAPPVGFPEKGSGQLQNLEEVPDVFVLAPSKDYHARVALAAYIESVRGYNEQLASDLEEFLALTMPDDGVSGLKMAPD